MALGQSSGNGLDESVHPENVKLAVCYPGDMPTVFASAFHSIINIEKPEGCDVRWFRGKGWCQARRRIHALEQALEWGPEVICTLDVDQVYEPDVLIRLLGRIREGYRMVGAMVPMRGYVRTSGMKPFQRLAWKLVNRKFAPVDVKDGEMQKAEFPTSACLMFLTEDMMKLQKPWYFFTYDKESWKQVHGEDATFAARFKIEAKVEAWVDTTIKVNHCHVFDIDETYSERFADWAEPGKGDPMICGYE